MQYVKLAPDLAGSSQLGLGCGSIMGRIGRAQSLRAVAAALDHGITHFDVARSYGYGEAEALLGEALRRRRDQVVIASKFGLNPPRAAGALRRLKPIAQALVANIPGLQPIVRRAVGSAIHAPDRFSVSAARASLEQSLAALKTDYIDILFAHDCEPGDLSGELLGFLQAQITAGKIRAIGVASSVSAVATLAATQGGTLLYQLANDVLLRHVERLPDIGRPLITHSPLRNVGALASLIASRPGALQLAPGRAVQTADLHPLMLAYAMSAGNIGVTLCSMMDEAHLRSNVDAVERPRFTANEIAVFMASVAAAPLPRPAA